MKEKIIDVRYVGRCEDLGKNMTPGDWFYNNFGGAERGLLPFVKEIYETMLDEIKIKPKTNQKELKDDLAYIDCENFSKRLIKSLDLKWPEMVHKEDFPREKKNKVHFLKSE